MHFPSQGKLAFGKGTPDYLSMQALPYGEKQQPWKAVTHCLRFPGVFGLMKHFIKSIERLVSCRSGQGSHGEGGMGVAFAGSWKKSSRPELNFPPAKSPKSPSGRQGAPASTEVRSALRKVRPKRCLFVQTLSKHAACESAPHTVFLQQQRALHKAGQDGIFPLTAAEQV